MKKWMLGMLATLFVGLFCIPMTVLAAPTKTVKIGTTELNETTPYYHNGADGAQGTVDNNPTDANAAFDASTGTLTLNGLHIETNEKAIYWTWQSNGNHDLNIVLADNSINTLICTASWDGIAINGAVGASGGPSLTIKGSGTLNATGNNHGIWVWQNVVIEGDAVVNASCVAGEAICNNSYNGTVTIKDNAVVTATGDTYGIGYSNGRTNTPVIQGGTLTVKGGTAAFQSAPDLEKYYYQAWVGNDEGDAATWDDVTALGSYKYVKLTVSGMKHIHSWATEWSSDADYHWHNCQGEGDCNIADVSQKDGYGTHSYDNDEDTTCDTCGYTRTINNVPDAGGEVEPTHTHIWATEWTGGDTYHWHNCEGEGDCNITAESQKDGYGTHAYDNDEDASCNVCGYTRTINKVPDIGGEVISGVVENITNKTNNECSATLDVSGSDLVGKILTAEEQQKVTSGKNAKIWLEVSNAESKATEEEKALVQSKLGEYTLGMYFDLKLWKQLDGEGVEPVTATNGAVTIKMVVPETLINSDTSKTRTYEIIRIHDDGTGAKPDVLSCSFDETTKEISFETDRFSIYVLAYKDTVNTPAEDNDVDDTEADNEEDTPAATETKQKDNVPKTGDNNCVSAWFLIALVSGIAVLFLGKRCLVVKK